MRMKALHIFLLLLGGLVISCLFTSKIEGLTTIDSTKTENVVNNPQYNPFTKSSATVSSSATVPSTVTVPPTAQQNVNFDEGIPMAQIPSGQEDLYILKSQIVPPVCPKCPTYDGCPAQKKCQPCPPCARCPEPAFECKKVPNYNTSNPFIPGLDFTSFNEF
tara:strand:+ start:167 stop:652 length:486 start_codon:yes stop_codon:yes gene_type:complete